jgi:hypothetical protein
VTAYGLVVRGLGSNGTFLDGRGVGQGAEPVRGDATIGLGDTVPLASDPTGPPNRAAQSASSPIRGRHVATCSPGNTRLEARATSRRYDARADTAKWMRWAGDQSCIMVW